MQLFFLSTLNFCHAYGTRLGTRGDERRIIEAREAAPQMQKASMEIPMWMNALRENHHHL